MTGEEIVAEARSWLGTPYQHQASLKGVATDCIGLVVGVARKFNLPEAALWSNDIRFRGYARTPNPQELLLAAGAYLDRLVPAQAGLGDILLFTFLKEPMHFGIISGLSPLCAVHAYGTVGKVVENSIVGKWERRIVGAYRYRGRN